MSGVAFRVEHLDVPARVARCEPHVLPPPNGDAVARRTLVSVLRQVCSVTPNVPAPWVQQSDAEALDPLNPRLELSYGRHRSTSCLRERAQNRAGLSACLDSASRPRAKRHSVASLRECPVQAEAAAARKSRERFLPGAVASRYAVA